MQRRSGVRNAGTLLSAATLLLGGCIGGPPTAPPPPVPAPAIAVEPTALDDLLARPELSPPAYGEEVVDDILASDVMRDGDFQEAVQVWIDYWEKSATPWFPDFVRRMGHYQQTVDSALAEREMPVSLRYLPLIESGYNPTATSGAAAVGLWQFMEGTAGDYGMDVTPLVDERRNPFKSTEAGTDYLSALRERFGSWFLALAAYNSGPTRTRRILNRHAPLAEPSDSLFWALRHHFPRETRDFVPKLVGAIVVATDPGSYGYELRPDPPLAFDSVRVPDATTLDVVARAAETTEQEIAGLNPELIRGITPPGEPFTVRIPPGRAATFAVNYALIPPNERVSFLEHTVVSGETLSHIARRYRIRVADLEAANPDVRERYLKIGARLTVPLVPGLRE